MKRRLLHTAVSVLHANMGAICYSGLAKAITQRRCLSRIPAMEIQVDSFTITNKAKRLQTLECILVPHHIEQRDSGLVRVLSLRALAALIACAALIGCNGRNQS